MIRRSEVGEPLGWVMRGSLRFWQRMCPGAEEGFALRLWRIRSPQDQAEWERMREEFGK
jgi:hypothetical protein